MIYFELRVYRKWLQLGIEEGSFGKRSIASRRNAARWSKWTRHTHTDGRTDRQAGGL